jgi:hypothetical protein
MGILVRYTILYSKIKFKRSKKDTNQVIFFLSVVESVLTVLVALSCLQKYLPMINYINYKVIVRM